MISWNARVTIVALLLAGTALFLQARARSEFVLPQTALASFPVELQNWVGTDVFLDDESLKTLRPGDFLQRTYRDENGGTGYVDLYVAYLQNQHALFHHLPQDCLEGSGWSPVESGTTTLAFPGEAPFPANRYLIAKGDDRQLVLFWYSARGRRVASEDWMNVYLAFDSLRSEPHRQRADSNEHRIAARRKARGRGTPAAFVCRTGQSAAQKLHSALTPQGPTESRRPGRPRPGGRASCDPRLSARPNKEPAGLCPAGRVRAAAPTRFPVHQRQLVPFRYLSNHSTDRRIESIWFSRFSKPWPSLG